MRTVICDIDGTLALNTNRDPFEYEKCGSDLLNEPVATLLWALEEFGCKIIYVSGREDYCAEETSKWLEEHHLPEGKLYMRKTEDYRKDTIIKKEIYDAEIKDKHDILFAVDDRTQVVELWRSLGLTCLQVADGNF